MKKVLITGENGYVSKNLVSKFKAENIKCESKSVRETEYEKIDFTSYSTVIHTAAVVHRKGSEKEYINVNRDLTIKIAKDCKKNGVSHFIFLSTMNVFGKTKGPIDRNTPLNPKTLYGKSKLAAEIKLKELEDKNFKIAIIRPPMVYGKNSPGNYRTLSKLSRYLYVVPLIENKRSMIFIDNLSQFILYVYDNHKSGLFHPQNDEYICTSNLIMNIRKVNKQKTFKIKLFNNLIIKQVNNNPLFEKIFGDLYYVKQEFEDNCYKNKIKFKDSIILAEEDK
ncbi:NAD-dependent epimerase/dehydratase family protein [Exiguobacterium sp. RIT341]|uniref:NAD-dependent epimerase/dehydratase family protein n=1 Tax=Exiguobacterium sp. RIT341 TaxID=1470592 RepID=UPI000446F545|nr:NAD-dependent epimerase/dehydratase family protein [Exiguobacterium sp. RIT341]EZP59697.1 NAD-dependent epimerase/dehydratase [Exiguobacterium sp. RIT341]